MPAEKRFTYAPYEGVGTEMPPAEMEKYIARYRELKPDQEVFPGIKQSADQLRTHFHVISPDRHLGPTTSIASKHSFHMSFLEVPPGNGGKLHAHNLPEVFICMKGTFEIIWGNEGQHTVRLAFLDTISVPIGVMRSFRNVGSEPGILQVIYDGGGKVLGEIFVPPKTSAA